MSNEEVLSFNIIIDAALSEETKKNLEELKKAEEPSEVKAAITDEEEVMALHTPRHKPKPKKPKPKKPRK